MKNIFLTLLLLLTVFSFTACEKKDASFGGKATEIKLLIVEPQQITLDLNTSHRYSAISVSYDGTKEDVTDQATWSVEDKTIATNENNIVKTHKVGDTKVVATLGSLDAKGILHVEDKIISSIDIYPASSSLHIGTTQEYRVFARYDDSSIQNITMDVEWILENDSNIISKYEQDTKMRSTSSNVIEDILFPFATAIGDNVGEDTLIATFNNHSANASVEVIHSSATSLVVTPISEDVYEGTTTEFKATLYYEDGSAEDVSDTAIWSSSDERVAVLTGAQATALSVGTTYISASYSTLEDSTDFNVHQKPISEMKILPVDKTVDLGISLQYRALIYFSDATFQDVTDDAYWSSSDENIATISNAQDIAMAKTHSTGTTTISASYSNTDASTSLTVTDATILSIQITPADVRVPKGTTGTYTAVAYYSDGSSHDITTLSTWISSNRDVLSIDTQADAQALEVGHSEVTAVYDNTTSNTARVEVTDAQLRSINITPVDTTVSAGMEVQYTAIGIYSDGSAVDLTTLCAWKSSQTDVATISQDALAKASHVGSTNITATFNNIQSNIALLNVTQASMESIQITPADVDAPKGTTGYYSAMLYMSDGRVHDITAVATWISEDSSIVTIQTGGDEAGYAQALEVGETTITASFLEITSNTAHVKVTQTTLKRIEITPTETTLTSGTDVEYKAVGIYLDNTQVDLTTQVAWRSTQTDIATIDTNGLAHALNAGETDIIASFDGVESNHAILHVTQVVIASIEITPLNISVPVATTGTYTATAHLTDGTTQDITREATWISADSSIVNIITTGEEAGDAEALQVGATTITASFAGTTSNIADVEVVAATLVSIDITPIDSSVEKGLIVQYKAMGNYSDNTNIDLTTQVDWKSSNTDIATIDTSALAQSLHVGVTNISATKDSIISNIATLTVTDATILSIQITPADVRVPKGTTGTYTAVAYYSDGSSHDITTLSTWISSNRDVLSIDTQADAQALEVGHSEVTAVYDNTTSNTARVEVTDAQLRSITIEPLDKTVALGLDIEYKATGTYSDTTHKDITELVTWSSSQTDTAQIDSGGLATSISIGDTIITATSDEISASTDLHVESAILSSIQITPAEVTVTIGTKDRFTATAYYSDESSHDVTSQAIWRSDNPEVVSIVASGEDAGMGHALKSGVANIRASFAHITGNTAVVTVSGSPLDHIQIIPSSEQSIAKGSKLQFSVLAAYEDGSHKDITDRATLSSSNTSVATIETNNIKAGEAHGIDAGTTDINAFFQGENASAVILNVTDATLTSIQVTPPRVELPRGTKNSFKATAYYSDNTIENITTQATWISSNKEVATILNGKYAGLAYALSTGEASITANLNGTTSNNAEVTVVENPILLSVEIIADDTVFPKGSTVHYTAYANYDEDGNGEVDRSVDVTRDAMWRSEDTTIATVENRDDYAEVYGVDGGTTDITIFFNGKTDFQTIIVTEAVVTEIIITPSLAQMHIGDKQQYIALAKYSDGDSKDVTVESTWKSSVRDVATGYIEDSKAIAEANTIGKTIITATFKEITSNDSNFEVIGFRPSEYIGITPLDESVAIGSTVQYTATLHLDNSNPIDITDEVTWASSDTDIATIDTDGLAHANSSGIINISASHQNLNSSTTLSVLSEGDCGNTKPQSIYIVPADATLGVAIEMQYELWGIWSNDCEMQLTRNEEQNWSSGDETIVSIGQKDGIALGISNGSTTINADYQTLTTTTGIEVFGGEEVLSVSIQPAPTATIAKGASQDYLCSARTVIDGNEQPEKWVTGEASFSSSDTKIAKIGTNDGTRQWVIAQNKAGHTTITCHYGGKESSSSLNVE
ncbi:MAG: Ig-like domain-containing protein [Campylobacterota bacterium]|nr:Ig-like domain-containing protein [Campylobacterota bacterium]